jgi:hypothetical protein
MEYVNFKKLNIKVRILSLKKNGVILGEQLDFWGNKYFIIKVGRLILPFKQGDFKYISHKK